MVARRPLPARRGPFSGRRTRYTKCRSRSFWTAIPGSASSAVTHAIPATYHLVCSARSLLTSHDPTLTRPTWPSVDLRAPDLSRRNDAQSCPRQMRSAAPAVMARLSKTSFVYLGRLGADSPAALCVACRLARVNPATQPGAFPFGGGAIARMSCAVLASAHDTSELEFHMSPVPSSSRPHVSGGTCGIICSSARTWTESHRSPAVAHRQPRRGPGCCPLANSGLRSGRRETCRGRAFLTGPSQTMPRAVVGRFQTGPIDGVRRAVRTDPQSRVVQVAPRPMVPDCLHGLVDAPVPTYAVTARAKRQPVQVDPVVLRLNGLSRHVHAPSARAAGSATEAGHRSCRPRG